VSPLHSAAVRLCAVAALLTLAACGDPSAAPRSAAATGFATVTKASLAPGTTVPAPVGQPILTVTGGSAHANSADGLALDMATLERLRVVSATVFEPYEKKHLNFSGVEMADVLRLAGVPKTASVHLTALDDYQVDLTAAELAAGGLMLATRLDGQAIPVASGGPTRLVFLDGTAAGKDGRQWIWSVARIAAKP